MNTAWTKGLTKASQEAKDTTAAFKEAAYLRRRMVVVLTQKYLDAAESRMSIDGYDSPGWALKQAELVGYARGLKEIITMLQEK